MKTINDTVNGVLRCIEVYESLGEAVRHAQNNPEPKSSNSNDKEFSLTASLQDACELATNGWSDVRPQVDKLFGELESSIAMVLDESYSIRFDYSGDSVDMGRYMSGDPECMMDYVTEPQARMGRVIKVMVNVANSARITPKQIMDRGVVVVALLDVLNKLGVGVELWTEMAISDGGVDTGNRFSQLVKIHDSSEMLDVDSTMFAIAHPSMLRRLAFGAIEQMPTEMFPEYRHGYGTPSEMQRKAGYDVAVEKLQDGHGDLVRDPVAWVLSTVKGLDLVA
jgi:hypothetical protein